MWLHAAIFITLMLYVNANDDVQYVKTAGVKGGHGRYHYQAGDNFNRLFGNQTQQGMRHNMTAPRNYEVGVCYIQVPTASLARDPSHVPVGNGTKPDLSIIRSCCKGYIRNIHNYMICDPVCSNECVNGLCTAPETCTCFPDHVRNMAGFCVATCPIGCQNGHCSGGECLCKEGYKLDTESKYCLPSCRENCGGIGNCTAPNTCECKPGYKSTPEGSCKPVCDKGCTNGECIAPNECRCHTGYAVDILGCKPICDKPCINGDCIAPNQCQCHTGYSIDQHGACKPVCAKPCENGECVAPNQCRCNNGYALEEEKCVPECQTICGLGSRCISPNVCSPVSPGDSQKRGDVPNQPYQPNSNQQPNQPNQPNYPYQPNQPPNQYPYQPNQQYPYQPNEPNPYQPSNQYPYPPNQQPSQHPYRPDPSNQYQPDQYYNRPHYPLQPESQYGPNLSNGTIPDGVSQCSQPCLNGVCIEGNRCMCNPGYVMDEGDSTHTRCLPHCPGGCLNGVCSAPRFCICNVGYYKDHSVKGRSVCIKRIRRSADPEPKPINVADLLIFDIPEY